jgi:hypothetical protein
LGIALEKGDYCFVKAESVPSIVFQMIETHLTEHQPAYYFAEDK